MTLTYERAPEHAVTMNQAPTEVLLALGLQDKMAGTAYIDDAILPEFEESYNQSRCLPNNTRRKRCCWRLSRILSMEVCECFQRGA